MRKGFERKSARVRFVDRSTSGKTDYDSSFGFSLVGTPPAKSLRRQTELLQIFCVRYVVLAYFGAAEGCEVGAGA